MSRRGSNAAAALRCCGLRAYREMVAEAMEGADGAREALRTGVLSPQACQRYWLRLQHLVYERLGLRGCGVGSYGVVCLTDPLCARCGARAAVKFEPVAALGLDVWRERGPWEEEQDRWRRARVLPPGSPAPRLPHAAECEYWVGRKLFEMVRAQQLAPCILDCAGLSYVRMINLCRLGEQNHDSVVGEFVEHHWRCAWRAWFPGTRPPTYAEAVATTSAPGEPPARHKPLLDRFHHQPVSVTVVERARCTLAEALHRGAEAVSGPWLRAVLFQVLFTLARIHRAFDLFRHNDLHCGNVLLLPAGSGACGARTPPAASKAARFRLAGGHEWRVPTAAHPVLSDFGFAVLRGRGVELVTPRLGQFGHIVAEEDRYFDAHTLLASVHRCAPRELLESDHVLRAFLHDALPPSLRMDRRPPSDRWILGQPGQELGDADYRRLRDAGGAAALLQHPAFDEWRTASPRRAGDAPLVSEPTAVFAR